MTRTTNQRDTDTPAYQRVLDILQDSIQTERLVCGTVLLEGPIAAIFGVSRSPVRQALEELLHTGLLERFPGRGLIVGHGTPLRVKLTAADLGLGRKTQLQTRRPGWLRIYDRIERDLIHLSMLDQFRVSEVELARAFGLSRAVSRDVLVQLQAVGIVVKDNKSRWLIVPLEEKRIRALFELRSLLEAHAIENATSRLDHAVVRRMLSRLDKIAALYPRVNGSELDRLETDLHIDCIGQCDNLEIIEALKRTRCSFISSKHTLGSLLPMPDEDPFLDEHRAVFTAILSGDAGLAASRLRAHLESTQPKLIRRVDMFRQLSARPDASYAEKIG